MYGSYIPSHYSLLHNPLQFCSLHLRNFNLWLCQGLHRLRQPAATAGPAQRWLEGTCATWKTFRKKGGGKSSWNLLLFWKQNLWRFGDVDKTCNVTNKCKGLLCLVCPSVWTRLEPYVCLKTSQFAVCLHLCHIHKLDCLKATVPSWDLLPSYRPFCNSSFVGDSEPQPSGWTNIYRFSVLRC